MTRCRVVLYSVVVLCCVALDLLARRMLTCGLADSGSGTQSGWIRLKSSTWSWSSVKQHAPTDGPTATTMSLTRQPNSVTMVSTVAMATPFRVPFQPEKQWFKVTNYIYLSIVIKYNFLYFWFDYIATLAVAPQIQTLQRDQLINLNCRGLKGGSEV